MVGIGNTELYVSSRDKHKLEKTGFGDSPEIAHCEWHVTVNGEHKGWLVLPDTLDSMDAYMIALLGFGHDNC